MATTTRHQKLFRSGLALAVAGLVIAMSGLALHAGRADAVTEHVFEGNCISLTNAGVCVLDEPEGNNPAVHGLVSYLRGATTMTFTIDATDPVTEVQICMQASGPFEEGANVCAGSHGNHVPFTHPLCNIYTVDLDAAGLANANPLYWTLHVVAGGRTLQVLGSCAFPSPTTTTTTPEPTTTSTPATTTTIASTTTSALVTTTTGEVPTTTTIAPTTTTIAPTTTIVAPTTTSTVPATTTTAPPSSTSTAAVSTTTSTTAVSTSTSTTSAVQVLPKTLSRTGGPSWWMLLMGAAMMLVGVTMITATRVLDVRD